MKIFHLPNLPIWMCLMKHLDSVSLSEIAGVQNRIGDTVQKILKTGKVKEFGVFIDEGRGFFNAMDGLQGEL